VTFHQLPLLDPLLDEPSPPRETLDDPLDEPPEPPLEDAELPPDTDLPDGVTTWVELCGTVVVPPLAACPTEPLPP
jgi:hypothetical protein